MLTFAGLEARDARDRTRSVAPLKPAEDALLLDNSALSIEASVQQVLGWWQQRRPFPSLSPRTGPVTQD
jgi:3-phosphoshikimate 1-carboxyvinyltransferase